MNSADRDIHVLRYFSTFISVSGGKVINITDPALSHCPLASHLYKGLKALGGADKEAVKSEIKKAVESKIRGYGFFTRGRVLTSNNTAIPYGASEMLMFALNKKALDAAVVVCDGAGTTITDRGDVVQGIGARMNSLLLTSPIKETINRLKKLGSRVISENALIDQVRGAEKAIEVGYKKIAVTVSGHNADRLREIRRLEADNVAVTILVVCTTGVTGTKINQIRQNADLVWSCASSEIRKEIGAVAKLQISKQIPVFVLTQRGIDCVAAYAQDDKPLRSLDNNRQYLISNEHGGSRITLGRTSGFLREEYLPVFSRQNLAMTKT